MFCCSILLFVLIAELSHSLETTTIETNLGRIVGKNVRSEDSRNYVAFQSIPYATPPVGEHRFLPAQLNRKWTGGLHDGTVAPMVCPQLSRKTDKIIGQEDCLVLNIFAPNTSSSSGKTTTGCELKEGCVTEVKTLLPVMVYVHGGAFVFGSGDPSYSGPDILVAKDVILITLNYRLGALGFFTLLADEAPGNLGLRDLLVALDWVQENIEDYGGDKNGVTLFGHSAGSMAVSALMTNEAASFQRAILQSGTLIRPFFQLLDKTNRTQVNLDYASTVGCANHYNVSQTMACLKSTSVDDLVAPTLQWPLHTIWEPVVDAAVSNPILPLDPFQAFTSGKFRQNIDVIIGSASGDGIQQLGDNILSGDSSYSSLQESFSVEGPKLMLGRASPDKQDVTLAEKLRYFYVGEKVLNSSVDLEMVQLTSDNMYRAGGTPILDMMVLLQGGNSIYRYLFDYVGTVSYAMESFNLSRPELGACHGDELLYLFPVEGMNALVSENDKHVSDLISEMWTNFAKTGNPNPQQQEAWSQFSSSQQYLRINQSPSMQYTETDRRRDTFWKHIFFQPEIEESSVGLIKGAYLTSVRGSCIKSYQGVPYAEPPTHQLRFMDPVPLDSWQGTLDATNLGASCMQADTILRNDLSPFSEDCLFLNIYRPCSEEKDLPVIVWIHGGALSAGSGGTHFYGSEFLVDENVVLVTLNYRLIPFGFMSLESTALPGNQGLKDQRLAMKWVQKHIESFGGSKSKVTVYGESAGSRSVLNHLSTPYSEGLFSAAIASGSSTVEFRPGYSTAPGDLRKTTLEVAGLLNCSLPSDYDLVSCLQDVNAQVFLEAALSNKDFKYEAFFMDHEHSSEPFYYTTPRQAFQNGLNVKVPVIIGYNREDGVMSAAKYISNPSKLEELNSNWELYGTTEIFDFCCDFTQNQIDTANIIRNYYFGAENITMDNIENLIRLYSDKSHVGTQRILELLAKYSTVYQYLFSYRGSFTISSLLGVNSTMFGAGHADDVQYLFNPHSSLIEFPVMRTDTDKLVRDYMVKLWTNFAKTKQPTQAGQFDFEWSKLNLEDPKYLVIDGEPFMDYNNDMIDGVRFWEGLFPLDPTIKAPVGTIIGSWDTTENGDLYKSFKGLKYGNIPRRFQEAAAVETYSQDVYAKSEGAICPQLPSGIPGTVDEDCLNLNIYTPERGENLPVMVWIHGGAFILGSGGSYYFGPNFLLDKNVILVTINYRLGAFGYLSLENSVMPGNMGFRDQILALKWIKRNIESFGGDPEDITLFGESAGSFSVMYQVVSPLSAGLFQKAIAQSGAPFELQIHSSRPGKNRKMAVSLAEYFDCDTQTDLNLARCLETKSVEEILYANYICTFANDTICSTNPWDAIVDTYSDSPFLPDTPENLVKSGQHNKIPVVIGVNSEEGIYSAAKYIRDETAFKEINEQWNFFGPLQIFDTSEATLTEISLSNVVKEFYLKGNEASMETLHDVIDMFSDIIFWTGAYRFASIGFGMSDVYMYQLTYKSNNSFADLGFGIDSEDYRLGVCHGDDLYHIFQNGLYELAYTEDDLIVREHFLSWWTDFAKTGKPSADWAPFRLSEPGYMEIKSRPEMTYSDRYKERMDFWMEIMDRK